MKTANCPSCGAEVLFRAPGSILAVCEYCRSTLVRHGQALEDIGKMAELMDDPSLLQLGAEGTYRGRHFAVIGRIQLQYRQGLWNEWHLLFDDQRTGWLGEASGQYTLTFLVPPKEPLPGRGTYAPGSKIPLAGQPFTVTDIEDGHCIAGEGELPFRVGAGFPAASVDLRNGRAFATIDYSEEPPLLFVGEAVEFADLRLTGLREAAKVGVAKAGVLRCPSCGAPLSLTTPGIKSIACGSCHSILDAEDPQLAVLSRFTYRQKIDKPIPLGSEGTFDGKKFRVIGFMKRATVGPVSYAWREYLLHSPGVGFRWLTESNGHWSWVSPLASNPTRTRDKKGRDSLLYKGVVYTHFESVRAQAAYVEGEFYWKVEVGETAVVSDYTAPPRLVSEEKTANEINWSLAEYIEPDTVGAALGLKAALPKPVGVAANQPWPSEAAYRLQWRVFRWCAVSALLAQLFFVFSAQNKEVFSTALTVPPGKGGEAYATEDFRLDGRPGNVQIINQAQVDNDWIYLDLTLVNKDTGETFEVSREIDYYHGCDDGCWTEGETGDKAVISSVPAGNYYVLVESETRPDAPGPFSDRLIIKRDVPGWLNFFLTLLGLLAFPLVYLWRRSAFEQARWQASDHPIGGGED